MNQPSDNELLLFHFGEDLGPERMAWIAAAVAGDADTARRYAELRRLLDASATALDAAEPSPGAADRIWRRLLPQLEPQRAQRRPVWLEWLLPGLALAASIGLGIVIGRSWQAPAPAPAVEQAPLAFDADAGDRVLAAHLARHLGQTERLLRIAENGEVGADQLAATLVEGNRLYAAAALRAGKPALAQFLSDLEPVLRELANDDGANALGGAGVAREQIRSGDLLFRLRALAELQSAPTQRL
jgi:hypothetical protein